MEQEQYLTLGELIRQARKNMKWSQNTLAARVGVTPMTIRRWEANRASPRSYALKKLKTLLGIPDEMIVAASQVTAENPKVDNPEMDKPEGEETDIEDYAVEVIILPRKVYRGLIINKRWVKDPFGEDVGWASDQHVTVNGEQLPFHEKLHPGDSPDRHFDWGRMGTGPSNLAVSILQDYFLSALPMKEKHLAHELAWKYSGAFHEDFVWWFPAHEEWELWSGAITAWLEEQKEVWDQRPLDPFERVRTGWCGWSERWDKYKGT